MDLPDPKTGYLSEKDGIISYMYKGVIYHYRGSKEEFEKCINTYKQAFGPEKYEENILYKS